jgi:hypothetical protein
MVTMKRTLAATLSLFALGAQAQITYTTQGSFYTQNFDSLAASGSNLGWINDSTLPGWSLFRQPSPGTGVTAYNASTGSSTTGSFYSYGSTGSPDRALGGLAAANAYFGTPANGSVAGWIALEIRNDTGSTLPGFTLSYRGEQWRNGGNTSPQTMTLEYGFGASFENVTAWQMPGGTFDWTSPVATASAGLVDGNAAGSVGGLGGTLSGLSWNTGESLWLRWTERNDLGSDHGLAIDSFSFTAVPEPRHYMLGVGLGLMMFAGLRRRRARPV